MGQLTRQSAKEYLSSSKQRSPKYFRFRYLIANGPPSEFAYALTDPLGSKLMCSITDVFMEFP